MAVNFLLGSGEKLTKIIPPPKGDPDKWHPYALGAAKERLAPRIGSVARSIAMLPAPACPRDEAVALLTLHPAYLAKSYFPDALLNAAQLRPIGSRSRQLFPEVRNAKAAKRETPDLATELYVAGPRSAWARLPIAVQSFSEVTPEGDDFRKIEDVRFQPTEERLRLRPSEVTTAWEVVLHKAAPSDTSVARAFTKFVEGLGGRVDFDRRFDVDGLCFLPAYGEPDLMREAVQFAYVRIIRAMPELRPITRTFGGLQTFDCELPTAPPLDPSAKVVIFDGGRHKDPGLDRYVIDVEPPGIGPPDEAFQDHGLGVASAYLFGPIAKGAKLPVPYSTVDLVRVLDKRTWEGRPDYFDVLHRIDDHLAQNTYDFGVLCIGPNDPIEDDEPHAWTTVLDPHFFRQEMLAMSAVGNNGRRDRESGNARVQPPSDCVNGAGVGAADRPGSDWKRADYSALGFGRSPGRMRPSFVAWGGSDEHPFFVLGPAPGTAVPQQGTSFSTPYAMRSAVGVRALLGTTISPLAIHALLVNRADDADLPSDEVGWGRVLDDPQQLVTSGDDTIYVVYQDVIAPGQWIEAPVPVPEEDLQGMVQLSATITFQCETDPAHPVNYTRAGIEVRFRPHDGKFTKPKDGEKEPKKPKTRTFFSSSRMRWCESELREDGHKWETVVHAADSMRGSSLKDPRFEIHYNARKDGGHALQPRPIRYAMVVRLECPRVPDLYNRIVRRYRAVLQPLRPIVRIQPSGRPTRSRSAGTAV